MSEAVSYLVNLEIRPAKKLENKQEVISIDDTAIDVVTYEYKKRLFDQLAELLLNAENLRENIHLMGRPGARSVMLSAEKQVLYENMDDCVNGNRTEHRCLQFAERLPDWQPDDFLQVVA